MLRLRDPATRRRSVKIVQQREVDFTPDSPQVQASGREILAQRPHHHLVQGRPVAGRTQRRRTMQRRRYVDIEEALERTVRIRSSHYFLRHANGRITVGSNTTWPTHRRHQRRAAPHGFRPMFEDWARSCSAFTNDVSELALADVSRRNPRW